MIHLRRTLSRICVVVVLGLRPAEPAGAQTPNTWFPTGQHPEDYTMGGNPAEPHGHPREASFDPRFQHPDFGSWASATDATPYRGQRLRLSGFVRTESVVNQVALWMRVEGPEGSLTFDDMNNRPIKGTTGWRKFDIVLDLPATATRITYGLLLAGPGQAWFDGVTLGPVGTDSPITAIREPFSEYFAGHYAEAAKLFPGRIAQAPTSFTLRLFQFLALHRSGQTGAARTYIARVADGVTDRQWAGPVVLFYAARLSEEQVLKAAVNVDGIVAKQRECEAYYYLAMAHVLKLGNVSSDPATSAAKAQEYLEKSVATGVTTYVEYRAAAEELRRLRGAGQ